MQTKERAQWSTEEEAAQLEVQHAVYESMKESSSEGSVSLVGVWRNDAKNVLWKRHIHKSSILFSQSKNIKHQHWQFGWWRGQTWWGVCWRQWSRKSIIIWKLCGETANGIIIVKWLFFCVWLNSPGKDEHNRCSCIVGHSGASLRC